MSVLAVPRSTAISFAGLQTPCLKFGQRRGTGRWLKEFGRAPSVRRLKVMKSVTPSKDDAWTEFKRGRVGRRLNHGTSKTRGGSMHATLYRLMGAGLVSLPIITAHTARGWGGWAAITLRELPDYLVARQPTQLTFTVRQHGVHPLTGLKPTVEATSGKQRVNAT